MLFNIYIFNREGVCLYYHEWSRPKSVREGAGSVSDDQKMMFGLFFSLKTFAAAMDPKPEVKAQLGAPLKIGEACGFHSFRASNYRLHFLESPSGVKMVLNTDENSRDCRDVLQTIYANIFVEYVAKNPLYTPGQPFNYEYFTGALNKYLKQVGI